MTARDRAAAEALLSALWKMPIDARYDEPEIQIVMTHLADAVAQAKFEEQERMAKWATDLRDNAVAQAVKERDAELSIAARHAVLQAEEIARLHREEIPDRDREIARLKDEIAKVHTSNLMKALNVANEEIARLEANHCCPGCE